MRTNFTSIVGPRRIPTRVPYSSSAIPGRTRPSGTFAIAPFYRVKKNILTPTLFVGGNIDCNVPENLGGEQMYLSLKELGPRETMLVVYPDE